jgi:hypothetical protein
MEVWEEKIKARKSCFLVLDIAAVLLDLSHNEMMLLTA